MKSLNRLLHNHKLMIPLIIFIVLFTVFVLAAYFFNIGWTGFPAHIGPSLPPTEQYQPAKTLWDWLTGFAFPVTVGLGVAWFTTKFNEQQSRTDHEIASDNQRETALQTYLDRISELLLQANWSYDKPDQKTLTIIRARTLTTLKQLDPDRKTSLFGFLWEAGLIGKFSLEYADFSGADLSGAEMRGIKLNKANLSGTNLHRATLDGANLIGANLKGANLSGVSMYDADLRDADLTGADFTDAYLSRAKINGATYEVKQLKQATKAEGLIT
jgi:uncharacterized protein YjbI with pentapeptide repeats